MDEKAWSAVMESSMERETVADGICAALWVFVDCAGNSHSQRGVMFILYKYSLMNYLTFIAFTIFCPFDLLDNDLSKYLIILMAQ